MQVNIELGHQAVLRPVPTDEGFTHDWKVFVRGTDGNKIQHFVEECVFHLHDSYRKPVRVVECPPYEVHECGSGSFILPVDVYFKGKEEQRKIHFEYALFLSQYQTINNVRTETLRFKNPSDDFRQKLLEAGGIAFEDKTSQDTRRVKMQECGQDELRSHPQENPSQSDTEIHSSTWPRSEHQEPDSKSGTADKRPAYTRDQMEADSQQGAETRTDGQMFPDSSNLYCESIQDTAEELADCSPQECQDAMRPVMLLPAVESTSHSASEDVTREREAATSPVAHSPTGYCGLLIHGFPEQSTVSSIQNSLYDEYEQYGRVASIRVCDSTDPENLRTAVVSFMNSETAPKALKMTNGKVLLGSAIFVVPHQGYKANHSRITRAMDEYNTKASRTLFVGNITKHIQKQAILNVFQKYGHIIDIVMKPAKRTALQTNAFAFIEYDNIRSVVWAMREMDAEFVDENRVHLGFGKTAASNCVWIDNLPSDVSEISLRNSFDRIAPVKNTAVNRDTSRALVYYHSRAEAQTAVNEMRGHRFVDKGPKIQVDFGSAACQMLLFGKNDSREDQQTLMQSAMDTRQTAQGMHTSDFTIGQSQTHEAAHGSSLQIHMIPGPPTSPPASTSHGYSSMLYDTMGPGPQVSSPDRRDSTSYGYSTGACLPTSPTKSKSRSPLFSSSYRRLWSQSHVAPPEEQHHMEYSKVTDHAFPESTTDEIDGYVRPAEAGNLNEYHISASRTLAVHNLDRHCGRRKLLKLFKKYGYIFDIEIKQRSRRRLIAFIEYEDIKSVVRAMQEMDGASVGANTVQLEFGKTTPANSVWIDNLPLDITEEDLTDRFGHFGPVENCSINREKSQALVFYESPEIAEAAVIGMRGCEIGRTRNKIQVDFGGVVCQKSFFEGTMSKREDRIFLDDPIASTYSKRTAPETAQYKTGQSVTDEPWSSSSVQVSTRPAASPTRVASRSRGHSTRAYEPYYDRRNETEFSARQANAPPPIPMESTSYAHSSQSYVSWTPARSRSRSRSPLRGSSYSRSRHRSRDRSPTFPEPRPSREEYHRSRTRDTAERSADVSSSLGLIKDKKRKRSRQADDAENSSNPTKTLFVGNLAKEITRTELQDLFQKYGRIIEIDIKNQLAKKARTVYAFIEFEDTDSAVQAMRDMRGKPMGHHTRTIPNLEFGRRNATSCVRFSKFSATISDSMLSETFSRYGRIENQFINRETCQALVYYTDPPTARKAVEALNGRTFDGKKVQVYFCSSASQELFFEDLKEQGVIRPDHIITASDAADYELCSYSDQISKRQNFSPTHSSHASYQHDTWSPTRLRSMSPQHRSRDSPDPWSPTRPRSRLPQHRSRHTPDPWSPTKPRSRSSQHRSRHTPDPWSSTKPRSRSPQHRSRHTPDPGPSTRQRSRSPQHRSRHTADPGPPTRQRSRSPQHRSRHTPDPGPPTRQRSRSPQHRSRHTPDPWPPTRQRSRSPQHRSRHSRSLSRSRDTHDIASQSFTQSEDFYEHDESRAHVFRHTDTDTSLSYSEYHPKASRMLFVGGLEQDVRKHELQDLFGKYGRIIDIEVKRRGRNSSFAFIEYDAIKSVVGAMREVDGQNIGPSRVNVPLGFAKSRQTRCVWMDNLDLEISSSLLSDTFSRFGQIEYQVINNETSQALVYYESSLIAQRAIDEMKGCRVGQNTIQIDFASSECQSLFFDNMVRLGIMQPADHAKFTS